MWNLLPLTSIFEFCQGEEDYGLDDSNRVLMTPDGEYVTLAPEGARIIDSDDLEPGPTGHVVHSEPTIQVFPDFLSEIETQHLLQLVSNRWMPSHVKDRSLAPDVLKGQPSTQRSSWSGVLQYAETPIVEALERRLSKLAGMDVSHLEKLSLVRYQPGQQYYPHHDGRCRPTTIFIYLNDLPDDAEGETYFPKLNIKFTPRKGAAVMWNNSIAQEDGSPGVEDNRTLHAGLPPKSGVKYGVNCFFNEKVQRGPKADNNQQPLSVRSISVLAGFAVGVQPTHVAQKAQLLTVAPVPMQPPTSAALRTLQRGDVRLPAKVSPQTQSLPVLLDQTKAKTSGFNPKLAKALPSRVTMQPASALTPVAAVS